MSQLRESFRIGDVTVEIAEGDITKADVEAITNAANNALRMGGGVAGAIKRAGGKEIEDEAVAKGPIPIGSAIETGAGKLPYKYVIHGAVMGTDLRTNADLIAKTTRSCLELADRLGVESLALPAFGTGVGGFDMAECAKIMASEIAGFAKAGPGSLKRIVVVLWGEQAYRKFLEAARPILEEAA